MEPFGTQMAHLTPMEIANGAIEAGEEPDAAGCDVDEDAAAVGMLAAAGDEVSLLEPVEKAGNVGVAGDHASGNLAAEQAIGRAAQDAEDVVLVGGEVMLFEELCGAPGEKVSGALEFDEEGLFGTGGWLAGDGRGHSGFLR